MLSRAVLVIAVTVAAGPACSGDDDPAAALADRVHALLGEDDAAAIVVGRLDQLGVAVEPDQLTDAEVACPAVTEPDAGDEATCTASVAGQELELIVEFGADGTISIVAVSVAP